MDLSGTAKRVVLGTVRRGSRTVVWTPRKVYLGNFLYHWLHVHIGRTEGRDVVALRTPEMLPWLDAFPVARTWLVDRSEVRLTDRREPGMFQGWAIHYRPWQLEAFTRDLLATTTLPLVPRDDPDGRVVVNVRRGDYYSPQFAERYSIDTVAYLREALDRSSRLGGPVTEVHVVSDDLPWCREHLGWVAGSGARLTFQPDGATPQDDLVALATARRLVLTHSTFGYWGAHLSNALYGDNEELVVVPWFHDRTSWFGASYHLNPSWTVVRHLPGGWTPEPTEGA